jgi:hypothetical protein
MALPNSSPRLTLLLLSSIFLNPSVEFARLHYSLGYFVPRLPEIDALLLNEFEDFFFGQFLRAHQEPLARSINFRTAGASPIASDFSIRIVYSMAMAA